MPSKKILLIFLITGVIFSFGFTSSYGLTESVDVFGQINSVDLVLNDIWIEPENPRYGDEISVHGSVYNAGIISSGEVSDVVTIGYILNGELVEITLLENILPGIENGVEISSGPIFSAIPGDYTITGIINYHDTLSHLRDNPKNNIVQKIFQIGDRSPLKIDFDLRQFYDDKAKKQQIAILGKVTNIFQQGIENREVIIEIDQTVQGKALSDEKGDFFFLIDLPFKNELIEISTYVNENSFLPARPQTIFPIKTDLGQSIHAVEIIPRLSNNNLNDFSFTIILFQDSYEKIFKEISSEDSNKQDLIIENHFLTVVPTNHVYITEVYMEGRFIDAFQNKFEENSVIKHEISISESAQLQFRVINKSGEPQSNVTVENWIYSTSTNEYGFTDWIKVIPTNASKEPYVAKAIFPNGKIVWSEPFLIDSEEKKVIQIIK